MLSILITLVILTGIYAILTLALNLEYGFGGLWDLGIVAFFAVGAYTYAIFTSGPASATQHYLYGLSQPIIVGVLAAVVVGTLLSLLVGLITLRLRREYLLIVTFAFAEIVREIIINEEWLTNGVGGMYQLARPFQGLGNVASQVCLMFLILAFLVIVYLFVEKLNRSPFGRTLRAVRENEDLAISAGKSLFAYKLKAFVLAAAIISFCGPLFVWYSTLAVPTQYTKDITFLIWTCLVVGGIANNKGAVLGSLIIIVAQYATRYIATSADTALVLAQLRTSLIGVILIVILRLKPEGILAERKVRYKED